jgi:hypothetical protein
MMFRSSTWTRSWTRSRSWTRPTRRSARPTAASVLAALVLVAGVSAADVPPPPPRDDLGKESAADFRGPIRPAKYWRILGARSCYQKDRAGAIAAMAHLRPMDRQFVRYICNRNEIILDAKAMTVEPSVEPTGATLDAAMSAYGSASAMARRIARAVIDVAR